MYSLIRCNKKANLTGAGDTVSRSIDIIHGLIKFQIFEYDTKV